MMIFMAWVWDTIFNWLNFQDSSTVKWSVGPKGISAKVLVPPSASAPVAAVSIGKLIAVFDNYIVIQDMVSGETVRAAKMYHLRNSILSETTLDGTIWAFGYSGASLSYQARSKIPNPNPNGVALEYQRVTKVYNVGTGGTPQDQIAYTQMSSVYAAALSITTIAADKTIAVGTLITYLELGPPRLWAKKIDQTTP